MSIAQARTTFPATRELTYLDAAAVSIISTPVHDAVGAFLDQCMEPGAPSASQHHLFLDAGRRQAVREAAVLLNAGEDEIALVESTTHGLNIAANAIPLEADDQILVADTEYLQVAIPWKMKEASVGVEVVPVRSGPGGELGVEHFLQAMTERTRVVCVSSVQWCSGYRVDVGALGEVCRSRGIFLVVDAIQHLGACTFDVRKTPVDFLVAGGHKWLNAPFGCGVLYIAREHTATLDPVAWGYMALEPPEGGWGTYFQTPTITPYSDWHFQQSAVKFEIGGTSNYPGAVGLGASLAQINALGIDAIHRHILSLSDRLRTGLEALGARIISPGGPPEARSGITIFRIHDEPERDRALLDKLAAQRILIAQRYTSGVGGLRASTHFFNDESDVERLLEALRELV